MAFGEPREVEVYVLGQSSSGKAIKCSMDENGNDAFWLPKSQVSPKGRVIKGKPSVFEIPEWLCLKHRQICGDHAFEEEKERRRLYEQSKFLDA